MANDYTFANETALEELVNNISLADYSPQIHDNVYNSRTLLSLLKQAKKSIDGGVNINRTLVKQKQSNGGFYKGAETLNTSQDNSLTQVEFKWQNAYEPINITRDELRSNRGPAHKIADLISTKTMLSEEGMSERLEEAFSKSVGDSQDLISIDDICSTGVLGSIDGATSTFWQGTSTTSGAFATQGISDMTTLYYALSGGMRAKNPSHIITTDTIYQKFEKTLAPLERISNVSEANKGFETLTFKGKPFMYGEFIESGKLFMLNLDTIQLITDKETDMYVTPSLRPVNQMLTVSYILWAGNLITVDRRRNGKLISIT